jgi:hypothetical protein
MSNAYSYATLLVQAELQAYDKNTNEVIINDKRYKLNIDINKSEYSSEYVEKKLVKNRNLVPGKIYYFNLFSSEESDSEDFDQVTFISEEEPEA